MATRPHIEHDFSQHATLLNRLPIHPGPHGGKATVHCGSRFAVAEYRVDGDVFTEVGHPAAEAEGY